MFGFPFNIPRLRFPRLQANIQPLLPLLFSKKEKHCEKKLPDFWAVFKAERKAAPGAAHPAGSAPARAPTGPRPGCSVLGRAGKHLPHLCTCRVRGKEAKSFYGQNGGVGGVSYLGLHSNHFANGFVRKFNSREGAGPTCPGSPRRPRSPTEEGGGWPALGFAPLLGVSFLSVRLLTE